MKGFHVMTSLAYWVNRIQIKVILTALFVFERRDTISTETILASTKCPYSPPLYYIEHCAGNKISVSVIKWFIPCPRP